MGKENLKIEWDLCGAPITQNIMDRIFGQVASAIAEGKAYADIELKEVCISSFPRLIVDYGDVIYSLVKRIRELEGR